MVPHRGHGIQMRGIATTGARAPVRQLLLASLAPTLVSPAERPEAARCGEPEWLGPPKMRVRKGVEGVRA